MSSGPVPSPSGRPALKRRKPPGWRQWALALGGAAVFLVALIVFVNREDSTANQPAGTSSPSAIAEQNREARIIVGSDQAPHTVALGSRPRGQAAAARVIRAAVVGYMKRQIAAGTIDGPLMRSTCTQADGRTSARIAFRCGVVADNVTYPFLGVVDAGSRRVTYCKRDAPPVPSMNIPVSRRCT